jgi:hypothetical protein
MSGGVWMPVLQTLPHHDGKTNRFDMWSHGRQDSTGQRDFFDVTPKRRYHGPYGIINATPSGRLTSWLDRLHRIFRVLSNRSSTSR